MDEAYRENLAVFLRTMTTEQLIVYRGALENDKRVAEGVRRGRDRQKIEFCTVRLELIRRVLIARGVALT